MRLHGNDRRSEAGARLEMRDPQRVKTVPFARLRQAATFACVAARELRRMQSDLGQFVRDGRRAALIAWPPPDQLKAIACKRLLD
jgi:hypothetical protein